MTASSSASSSSTRDHGAPNPLCFRAKDPSGDAERAALLLEITGGGDAISRAAYTTGHEGTPDDQTTIVRDGEQKKLEDVKRPLARYSSQSKHATYTSKEHCEGAQLQSFTHRFCASEDCAPDGVSWPGPIWGWPRQADLVESLVLRR